MNDTQAIEQLKHQLQEWLTWADQLTKGKHHLPSKMRREISEQLEYSLTRAEIDLLVHLVNKPIILKSETLEFPDRRAFRETLLKKLLRMVEGID